MIPALLILDLDETLLYASEQPLERAAEFRLGEYHAYRRPYLGDFIAGIAGSYRVAVWTSASGSYASAAIPQLFPSGFPLEFVWSAARCVRRMNPESGERYDVKDLRKVKRKGFSLERVLMIDDSTEKLERHYGNHLRVRPFVGDPADRELLDLLPYLISIHACASFRTIEKRFWRSSSHAAQ